MKVGFIAPLGIAAVNGGVRTQAFQTAKALQNLGIEAEFISPWQESIEVDVAHIFVAGQGTIGIQKRCSELGIKNVLSPVFFSNRSAPTISGSLKIEKILSKLGSGISSDFGIKAEACQIADIVLPNTSEEAHLIANGFRIDKEKIHVVPNGVEARFAETTPDLFIKKHGIEDFILFVGQAGAPRKNIVKLLEVATNMDSQFVIIGSLYEDKYGRQCRALAQKAGNILFIDTLDHDSDLLGSAYSACNIFVLPSLYETPGIAAMEAALAGARIVITERGGTKEYFGEWAEYINPESSNSIAQGIKTSILKENTSNLKKRVLDNYTWDKIAEKTLEKYKAIL